MVECSFKTDFPQGSTPSPIVFLQCINEPSDYVIGYKRTTCNFKCDLSSDLSSQHDLASGLEPDH